MGAPAVVLFHRLRVIPLGSTRIEHGEEFASHDRHIRVKSMIQFVSQLAPLSSEKACSQRAASREMRDHTKRTRIARRSCSSSPKNVPMPLTKPPFTGGVIRPGRRESSQ